MRRLDGFVAGLGTQIVVKSPHCGRIIVPLAIATRDSFCS
jgi:hypothetical protein